MSFHRKGGPEQLSIFWTPRICDLTGFRMSLPLVSLRAFPHVKPHIQVLAIATDNFYFKFMNTVYIVSFLIVLLLPIYCYVHLSI